MSIKTDKPAPRTASFFVQIFVTFSMLVMIAALAADIIYTATTSSVTIYCPEGR